MKEVLKIFRDKSFVHGLVWSGKRWPPSDKPLTKLAEQSMPKHQQKDNVKKQKKK